MKEREQELQGLQGELQEERRSRMEERRRREEEIHREMQGSQQQEVLQLSQAKAERQLMTERIAELQEEVCVCACVLLMFLHCVVFSCPQNNKKERESCHRTFKKKEICICFKYSTGVFPCQCYSNRAGLNLESVCLC